MNCAPPGTEERNKCELLPFTKDSTKWLAAKVTVLEVQEGEQPLTRYGGRKVASTVYTVNECPTGLRHTIQPAIELSPPTAHGEVPTEYFGYSDDRSWELKVKFQGSRLVKRRQRVQVISLAEDAAVTYLLTRHAATFKLKIISNN